MKKILKSVLTIAVVGAVAVGVSQAFFSDTEISSGNTFTAGAIDLKIDSTAHYAGLTCTEADSGVFQWKEDFTAQSTRQDLIGDECDGTWKLTDLGGQQFFNLSDIKPGDTGENTVSFHLFDNDGWLRYRTDNLIDYENGCVEPEIEDQDNTCGSGDDQGELSANMDWHVWLDMGSRPGFQCLENDPGCKEDPTEGDNIQQTGEPTVLGGDDLNDSSDGLWPFEPGEQYYFDLTLATVRAALDVTNACDATDLDGDGRTDSPYSDCQGLATDGRIVGSTTYYFGTAWCYGDFVDTATPLYDFPSSCDGSGLNNVTQTDSLTADNIYEVVQHRNNPAPNGFTTP